MIAVGDEFSPHPNADWACEGGELVQKGSESILLMHDRNQERALIVPHLNQEEQE